MVCKFRRVSDGKPETQPARRAEGTAQHVLLPLGPRRQRGAQAGPPW